MDRLDVAKEMGADPALAPMGFELDAGNRGSSYGRPVSRNRTRLQSGLPLTMRAGEPLAVEISLSRRARLKLKRAMDVVFAGLALVGLLPLLLLVALIIKLTSPGPALFRQAREGLNGKPFGIYKFRSMDMAACDQSGVVQTVEGDARVTPFGKLLRRTSIDELPQLLNVLQGDMSLVGPRPHVAGMRAGGMAYRDLVPYYDLRLDMVPGLTGWAQVNGLRGPTVDATRARARVDHDIAYIQNFSLWLDLRIMVMTVAREFLRGTGD